MLGFATVDLAPDGLVTVWLTSRVAANYAGHGNAVSINEDVSSRRVLGMLADRYVVLTSRSGDLSSIGIETTSMAGFRSEVVSAQDELWKIFEDQRTRPGKKELADPYFPPPPEFVDEAVHSDNPQRLTLAVANVVRDIWTSWLTTEAERSKRPYMPRGPIRLLAPSFTAANHVFPLSALK